MMMTDGIPGRRSRECSAALKSASVAILALAFAGCSAAEADAPVVERLDSAGVELVRSLGGDRPLAWNFEPRLSVGGADEGPESFFDVHEASVAVDARGNLYVLDAGNFRVIVFDPAGEFVRALGRKGGGPGELEFIQTFHVSPEGEVNVFDFAKRGFVRWSPDGTLLPSRPLGSIPYRGGELALTGSGDLYMTVDSLVPEEAIAYSTILRVGEGNREPVVRQRQTHVEPRDFGCVRMSGFPRLFAPELTWISAGDSLVYNIGPDYILDVWRDGNVTRRISRDIPLITVTDEMALAEVGESMKVRFDGRGGCEVPPRKVVDVRGYAPTLPSIRQVRLSPEGRLWVKRGGVRDEPAPIDVFDATGAYTGTLPAGTPWPAAFTPDGDVVAVEKDELDRPRIVIYTITGRA